MEAIRITNPMWLGSIAPNIKNLLDRLQIEGTTYETWYAYLVSSVQFGKDTSELYVIFDNDKPIAFAHWFVAAFPNVSKTVCDLIYRWDVPPGSVNMLFDKWHEFGVKHRCKFWEITTKSRKVAKRYEELLSGISLTTHDSQGHLIVGTK